MKSLYISKSKCAKCNFSYDSQGLVSGISSNMLFGMIHKKFSNYGWNKTWTMWKLSFML